MAIIVKESSQEIAKIKYECSLEIAKSLQENLQKKYEQDIAKSSKEIIQIKYESSMEIIKIQHDCSLEILKVRHEFSELEGKYKQLLLQREIDKIDYEFVDK